ncbi:endonuclease/exonuclease/phosphatase family protein [Microbacterium sp. NPDC057944]|uniref:endonuclease/exonuclease/phosphatase family protein n=1 Tax=Microbacterium sp. NPDC057944 TaxID=3346286 RepID=UPI0036DB8463
MIDADTRTAVVRRPRTRAARPLAVAGFLLLVAVVCTWIPGPIGTAGAAALPWLGAALLVVAVLALLLARRVLLVLLVPVVVWAMAMAPALPSVGAAGTPALTIVSQNVRAHSGGAAASADELADTGADVIALVELDGDSLAVAEGALAERYPHSYAVGTVGIWSRYPLADAEPLTLGLGWKRAIRVTVEAPDAATEVYVLHAASVRPGHQDARDTMLSGLAATVAADSAESLVVVGDFNAASTDPALNPLRGELDWVRPTDASLGLTWPAAFPLTRIDQVFTRGLSTISSTTLPAGNSDHLATKTVLGR